MTAIESFKPLGAVSAIILAVGLLLVIKLWPQGIGKTFSQHVATSQKAILYYIFLFTIVLPLLLLFFIGWFIPTFHLPGLATYFLVLAAATQFVCTLVPETGGKQSLIHQTLASISAFSLLPVIAAVVVGSSAHTAAKEVIAAICFLIMASIVLYGIIASLMTKKITHNYLLIFQASYYVAFFVAVLSASYL